MPAAETDFTQFAVQIGLRKEHAEALLGADIRSPHELGSFDVEKLKGVCNSPLLINFIHPILAKYVFNIATAKDPFKKAMAILKKNAPQDDDDDEPMEVTAADSLENDAEPIGRQTRRTSGQRRAVGTNFNNAGARMTTTGGGMMQSRMGGDEDMQKPKNFSIRINGGNFVQANILGQGPVTYNNTSTSISTSLGSSKKLTEEISDESFFVDGSVVRVSDVGWTSNNEPFDGENIRVQSSSRDFYDHQRRKDDVYAVQNLGQNRALIINNYTFDIPSLSTRNGAARDTQNMERTLQQLGFQVQCETNVNKDTILQLLREFAESEDNKDADMVAVYIGSHGERDDQGHDTFVGVDGERIKFEDVKQIFSPTSSRHLDEKPKIFFLQFCRQDRKENVRWDAAPLTSNTHSDAGGFVDEDKRLMDFVCSYATLAGNKAYRDTMDGSWFVTCLVHVLATRSKDQDLQSMLTMVNNSVAAKKGEEGPTRALQISEVVYSLRKKIYFYPGMH